MHVFGRKHEKPAMSDTVAQPITVSALEAQGWKHLYGDSDDFGGSLNAFLVDFEAFQGAFPSWGSMITALAVDEPDSEYVLDLIDKFTAEPMLTMPEKQITISHVKGKKPLIHDGVSRLRAWSLTTNKTKFIINVIDFVCPESRLQHYCKIHSS